MIDHFLCLKNFPYNEKTWLTTNIPNIEVLFDVGFNPNGYYDVHLNVWSFMIVRRYPKDEWRLVD
jgi:hypothetical protein